MNILRRLFGPRHTFQEAALQVVESLEQLDAAIRAKTPSVERLRHLARTSPPPAEWYEIDEPLPFGSLPVPPGQTGTCINFGTSPFECFSEADKAAERMKHGQ